jgi:hypothetical protein
VVCSWSSAGRRVLIRVMGHFSAPPDL